MKDKSMKTFYKVLGCVAVVFSIITYCSFQKVDLETKDTESVPTNSQTIDQGQTRLGEVSKASSMVAVTTKNCPPCRRLKYLTITILLAEGYDVSLIPWEQWDGPAPDRFPTLYYYNQWGYIVRIEEGFRTATHVKKYLKNKATGCQ